MTKGQEIAVALFTFFGGSLSFMGSAHIIRSIIRTQKYKDDTYHRLLLGTCFIDLLSSLGWLMAPFAAPRDSSQRELSIGNTASCTAQAFLSQVGVGFYFYNACLSISFMLTIRYNVSKRRMIWREAIMHAVSLLWAFGSAIIPVPLELYNEFAVGSGCWLGWFPQYCGQDDTGIECIRGQKADPVLFAYIMMGFPVMASLVVVIVCNAMVYLAVRKTEVTMTRRYSIGNDDRQAKRSAAIAGQATCYVAIFLNSLIWSLLLRILDSLDVITTENESSWTAMILLAQFFSASSGFGFLLVYIRPRYLRNLTRPMTRSQAMTTALSFREAPPGQNRGRFPPTNVTSNVLTNAREARRFFSDPESSGEAGRVSPQLESTNAGEKNAEEANAASRSCSGDE